MRGRNLIGWNAAWAAVTAGLVAAGALAAGRPTSPGAWRATHAGSGQVVLPRSASVDTVVAEVGARRRVTATRFLDAWRTAMPSPPTDSLTPQAARRFLELTIDRELLAETASRSATRWTAEESVQYRALRDRLVLRAALDSALRATAATAVARGDTALDPGGLAIAMRDSAVARLAPTYDRALAGRLARSWAALPKPVADSGLAGQIRALSRMPEVDAAELDRPVARSEVGDYTTRDLLDAWGRLRPVTRPRIATVDDVIDMARNGLYERALRRDAERRGLERRPEIAELLQGERDRLAVLHYLAHAVVTRIPRDAATLVRYHARHRADYVQPTRLRALRFEFNSRSEADGMIAQLRDPGAADSLEARAVRGGFSFVAMLSAESDSALFEEGMRAGPDAVVGPAESGGHWRVARVLAVLPAETPSFEDVRDAVEARWVAEETERRALALCADLKRKTRCIVHAAALERCRQQRVKSSS